MHAVMQVRPRTLDGLIRYYRKQRGLTQREAAFLAGISTAALRDLEQGRVKTPRGGTLRRLADALELSAPETEALFFAGRTGQPAVQGLRIQLLGPLAAAIGEHPVELVSDTQRLLLGMLALSANTPVHRDELIDVIWGSHAPKNAVALLQSHVSRLRRRLEGSARQTDRSGLVVGTRSGYQLAIDRGQLDLIEYHHVIARARQAYELGNLIAAHDFYQHALGLWRGDPLADLAPLHINPAVTALQRGRLALVVEYADVCTETGSPQQALSYLQQAADAEPLHEVVHARLMIALASNGQQARALETFDRLRRRLADEFGADPGPELAATFTHVLNHGEQDLRLASHA